MNDTEVIHNARMFRKTGLSGYGMLVLREMWGRKLIEVLRARVKVWGE